MTKSVSKPLIYLSLSITAFGASAAIVKSRGNHLLQSAVEKDARPTDAAFRDGLFLGKLDADSAKKPHLSVGRWNTPQDRASFVAGYQQGYGEATEANRARLVP